MKEYVKKGLLYEITLDNGKIVKVASKWVENTMNLLQTDLEDVLLMYLEDNDYLVNDMQEELDNQAKANKVKVVATDKAKPKTQKERVAKEYPEKEMIINKINEILVNIAENVEITNKSKVIEFKIGENDYKIDLTCKRKPKKQ